MSDHRYFADWCDQAKEWCELACGYRADRVPIWYLAELFDKHISAQEAGSILARSIAP